MNNTGAPNTGASTGAPNTGASTGAPNTGANTNANVPPNPFMSMFGAPPANGANQPNPFMGMMGANMGANPNPAANMNQQQQQNAALTYANQLNQLTNMGFTDADRNLNALIATGGNVQAAIDRLLQG